MIVFAAVDLQQGEVVQLVGGRPDSARVRLPDPVAVALDWQNVGFTALHVVDLDAARGTGTNRDAIVRILESVDAAVQVGGGIRDEETVADWLELGATRVIVGTRAVEDPKWLAATTQTYPDRIVVAGDVRDDVVLTRGWTGSARTRLPALIDRLNQVPLAAVLITNVAREGRLSGIDTELFGAAIARSRHPVYAAGGIAGPADLNRLRALGAGGAVLGMALYAGAHPASSYLSPESGLE